MSLKHPAPPAGLVTPCVAQTLLLEDLVESRYEGSLWCLFDGSYTPSLGDSTYTILQHQVTWPGIVNPVADGWGSSSIGSDSAAVVFGPPLAWTFSAAGSPVVVGGAFGRDSSGNLLGAQLVLNGPVTLSVRGQVLPFQPVVRLSSIYGSDSP